MGAACLHSTVDPLLAQTWAGQWPVKPEIELPLFKPKAKKEHICQQMLWLKRRPIYPDLSSKVT